MIKRETSWVEKCVCFVVSAGLLLSMSYACTAGKSNPVEVEIYPNQVIGAVNRNILGNNIIGYKEGYQQDSSIVTVAVSRTPSVA